jgi:hypothetical protein
VDQGSPDGPAAALARLQDALNRRDLEAFVACFAPDYRSEQPIHPSRVFAGRDRVRANWSAIFGSVPDFGSVLVASATDGTTAWAEWHWFGTRVDGAAYRRRGVTVFGVGGDGLIDWGRLYMEPVEESGVGIEETIRRATGRA